MGDVRVVKQFVEHVCFVTYALPNDKGRGVASQFESSQEIREGKKGDARIAPTGQPIEHWIGLETRAFS